MDTVNISQILDQSTAQYALPAGLIILLLALLVLKRKSLAQSWLKLRTRMRLNRLGHGHLTKLRCPDGLGYDFVIDHLVLRHDGISVLMNINYPGKIFCADDINDWTQMLGRKSYRFKNPFYDLECQVKAVADCVPGVAVDGYLFFDHQASFPKGHPERVIYLANIPQRLERDRQLKVNEAVKAAWGKLKTMPAG